jgi:hypothetical protein
MNERRGSAEPADLPGKQIIYICITLDTDAVLARRPESGHDRDAPASVSHTDAYWTVTASGPGESQGTGDIVLDAEVGYVVRFFAKSASNQFDHAVVLMGIRHTRGDEVLDSVALVTQERLGIAPASAMTVLPARFVPQQFSFCEGSVAAGGTGGIELAFAVHDRDEHGQPRLVGRYQWESRITFHLHSSSRNTTSRNQESAS